MLKFNAMKTRCLVVAGAAVPILTLAGNAYAELSAADLAAIQAGVSGADTNYYLIGGGILVVMAGIWGFKMIKGLIR